MAKSKTRLLFLVSEDWYFVSHRLHLAKAALLEGFEVAIATRIHESEFTLQSVGLTVFPILLERSSKNPFKEFRSILQITKIYRSYKPDIVHHVALKPCLYGSVAAIFARVPVVINALAGLGYVFTSRERYAQILRPIITTAFRLLFNRSNSCLIIQNADDQALMLGNKIITPEQAVMIRGAGVDLEVYRTTPFPEGDPLIVFAARMLWDKGLKEFVDAARILKDKGIKGRFVLVGTPDPQNPASASESDIEEWVKEGVIEWWGQCSDMPIVFAQARVVCLASYREGLPKVLIEAAACGRPIVTTDVPGCREVVIPGESGYLVPSHNAETLADAISELLNDMPTCREFGMKGRQLVEQNFAQQIIARQTLDLYRRLLPT
ncbi:MAG TPA: glycosyltransferase family 4 protein [Methylophilaceae bacterium]|nr:glycosyltransferase family 4 protein [Methylophilaceae bacterium]